MPEVLLDDFCGLLPKKIADNPKILAYFTLHFKK